MNRLLKAFFTITLLLFCSVWINEAQAYINISQNVNCQNIDEVLQNLNASQLCNGDAKCEQQVQKRKEELDFFKKQCDAANVLADSLGNAAREHVTDKGETLSEIATETFSPSGIGRRALGVVEGAASGATKGVVNAYTSLSGYDSSKPTTVSYVADSNMTCFNVDDKIKDLEKGHYSSNDENIKKAKETALQKLKAFQKNCQSINNNFPGSMEGIKEKYGYGFWGDTFYSDSKKLEANADYNEATLRMLTLQAENGSEKAKILLKNYQILQEQALQANSHLASEYYAQAGHARVDQTTPGNLMASTANYDRQKKQNNDIKNNMTDEDIEKAKANGAYDDSYELLHRELIKEKEPNPDNSACDIAGMQQNYQSRCYSCKVILTLITVFMNACAKVYDLTREAGSKILVIGCLFWFASFSLKKVSAFTSQEPMQVLNELFTFMFKAMAAYIVLNFGIAAIVNLFINPLLVAGADYGIGLLKAANSGIINIAETTNYSYKGTEIIPAKTINKLMALTQGIDKTVATNLVVGHALTCHAINAGLITLVDTDKLGFQLTIRIPDIWIWLCGAAIWFCGFMLTLGVGYYLLDTSYRIGFCIIALPIVIGLWPFEKTKGKFSDCMSIIIRASALFAFLSLTVSYALTLISGALGDVSTLYAKVQAGDSIWISDTFAITGSKFIIIVFAYVYSIKLVGATVTSLLSKFFDDKAFGNEGKHTSMHYKATQMTDFAKKKVTQVGSAAMGVAGKQTTRLVGATARKATHAVGSLARGAINMAKKKKSSGSDE